MYCKLFNLMMILLKDSLFMQIVEFNDSSNVMLTWNLDMCWPPKRMSTRTISRWTVVQLNATSGAMVAEGIQCPISSLSDTNSASHSCCRETKCSILGLSSLVADIALSLVVVVGGGSDEDENRKSAFRAIAALVEAG